MVSSTHVKCEKTARQLLNMNDDVRQQHIENLSNWLTHVLTECGITGTTILLSDLDDVLFDGGLMEITDYLIYLDWMIRAVDVDDIDDLDFLNVPAIK